MVDRVINYIGAVPLDVDLLNTNKNLMIGLGFALQAILGGSTVVDGLACTPTGPASQQVLVAQGSIYSTENVDGTAYGSLGSDTSHQILKQGMTALGNTAFTCAAPSTSGNSIAYLIQGEYQDVDGGSTVLPYYNASNPAVAYNGPANAGTSQNTVRQGKLVLNLKAGTSATTGTQVTPTPDAGFTGLWVVTVANGITAITSGMIALYPGAPFINYKLPQLSPAGPSGRTVLSGNTTFYVATTGSDSAAGTSGAPWQTIQHAINVLMDSYDLAGFMATISVATGTYTSTTNITGPFTGGGTVLIQGVSSPVLTSSSGNTIEVLTGASVGLAGLTIEASSGNGIHISGSSAVTLGSGMNFGACAQSSVLAEFDGYLNTIGQPYTISGGGTNHINLRNGGNFDCNSGSSATVTISGTPTFSGAFINAQACATALIVNYTWSGSITGAAYSVTQNAVIQGVTGLPGTTGSSGSGGQFS